MWFARSLSTPELYAQWPGQIVQPHTVGHEWRFGGLLRHVEQDQDGRH